MADVQEEVMVNTSLVVSGTDMIAEHGAIISNVHIGSGEVLDVRISDTSIPHTDDSQEDKDSADCIVVLRNR